MNTCQKYKIYILLLTNLVGWASRDATALSMPEKEHVQATVFIVEVLSLVSVVGVFWFIWKISTEDRKNRASKQKDQ